MPRDGNAIDSCKAFTDDKLKQIESALSSFTSPNWALIANGSYARREASTNSDFDYFILHEPGISPTELERIRFRIREVVKEIVGKPPAEGGAFDSALEMGALIKNIGGTHDVNENITRRILFLTEGHAVTNPDLYSRQREDLIKRYVSDDISDHQLGLFLLNDLIRYYRTVCVDFEFKTFEGNKAWGIRNIKLVFSRKLLYISGVLVAAEMAQRTATEKRNIARELSALSPIERLRKVCRSAADRALEEYEIFLSSLEQKDFRDMLERVTVDRSTHTEEFKSLKNRGHHFSFHLMGALNATYSESHPIHRALIM